MLSDQYYLESEYVIVEERMVVRLVSESKELNQKI